MTLTQVIKEDDGFYFGMVYNQGKLVYVAIDQNRFKTELKILRDDWKIRHSGETANEV